MDDKICLVIPYYEGGDALTKSLGTVRLRSSDSIIIVDDGSTRMPLRDYCPDVVGETPVTQLRLDANQGITAALVAGIDQAPSDAQYISRLDCGDLCSPDRFEVQRDYLNAHPACALVGSWVTFCTPEGQDLYTVRYPESSEAVRRYMRRNSAFSHPAVTFRLAAYRAVGGYSFGFPAAEDYALFREIAAAYESTNLPRVLVWCQTSDGGISVRWRRRQLKSRIRVMLKHFDGHPGSTYGIARAVAQFLTPRFATTVLRRTADQLRLRRLDGG